MFSMLHVYMVQQVTGQNEKGGEEEYLFLSSLVKSHIYGKGVSLLNDQCLVVPIVLRPLSVH